MDLILDPGLVLYLPLHELDGSSLMSKDHYGHLATVTGALWTPQGRTFDLTDDNVVIANNTLLNPTGDLTLEAWYKPGNVTGAHMIINKWSTNTGGNAYMMYTSGTNSHIVVRNAADDADVDLATTAAPLVIGTWIHIVGVLASGTLYQYFNGVVDPTTLAGGVAYSRTNQLWVGLYPAAVGLGGTLGEVRIYSKALSATEVQYNYLVTKWRYQ